MNLASCLDSLLPSVTLTERLKTHMPLGLGAPYSHTSHGGSAPQHPPRPSQQVAPTQHYTYTTAPSGPWNWKPAGKPQWGRRRAGAMSSAGLHRAPPEPQPREPTCHATRFTSKSQTQATCILTAPPASAEIAEQHNDKQSQ